MDANASSSPKIENPQNRVIRQKRSLRNMDQLRARFNSRAGGIWFPRINEQGTHVGTRSPTLNDQLPPPPPPAVQYSQILSRMYGIVPANQSCAGLGPNPLKSSNQEDWQRPQTGSNATPNVVDTTSPRRNDWDGNLRTTSEPDLQVRAAVPKQENSLGMGTIGRLETSSLLKSNSDNPSTDCHSSCEKSGNNNNVVNKEEEGEEGTRNDDPAAPTPMMMNEGAYDLVDLEEEYCCFPDIAEYYLDYEYEEWIKWPDDEEQFRSLYR